MLVTETRDAEVHRVIFSEWNDIRDLPLREGR
jgi:hypothetical protein